MGYEPHGYGLATGSALRDSARLANSAPSDVVRPASLVERSSAVASYAAEVAAQAENLIDRLVGAVPGETQKGQSVPGDGMFAGVRYDLTNIEDRLSEISHALQRLAKAVG